MVIVSPRMIMTTPRTLATMATKVLADEAAAADAVDGDAEPGGLIGDGLPSADCVEIHHAANLPPVAWMVM